MVSTRTFVGEGSIRKEGLYIDLFRGTQLTDSVDDPPDQLEVPLQDVLAHGLLPLSVPEQCIVYAVL